MPTNTLTPEDVAAVRRIHEHYMEEDQTITGAGAKYAAIDTADVNAALAEFLGDIAAEMDQPTTIYHVMMSVGMWIERNDDDAE